MNGKKNILLIMTDQHALSAVGAYGRTPCRTPHIDRLASEGVRFETAYTTCPVCSPARATVMTGRYPHAHGITSNVHNLGSSVHEIPDSPHLLSRRLEAGGYSLGYTGKWHLGTDVDAAYGGPNCPTLPKHVGFEGQNFPGHGNGGHKFQEFQEYLSERGLSRTLKEWDHETPRFIPAGEEVGGPEATVPYFLAEHTMSLIDSFSEKNRPFFIWHNFWGPHGPYYAPTEAIDPYRDMPIPEWPNYRWPSRSIPGPHHNKISPLHEDLPWEAWQTLIRYYYAFAGHIDAQIGRIMERLRDRGLLEDTVVIFTADHGETLGTHGGLQDKGWHHFEETHRIPLIVRGPGCRGGIVRREFASLADVYPTILDLAGIAEPEADTHGRSLVPLAAGGNPEWRDVVVTEFGGVNQQATTMRTVRCGSLKYGYCASGPEELYDLDADPYETRNVINHPDYRERADDMRRRLLLWMQEHADPVHWRAREQMSYHLKDLRVYDHPYR